MHRALERLAQLDKRNIHAIHGGVLTPWTLVILGQRIGAAVVPVARRELCDVGAGIGERLHFRCHAQPALLVVAPIQRHHTDGITRDDHAALGLVPQRESENTVEAVEVRGRLVLAVQRVDHFAVRRGLERVGLLEFLLQFLVVVDLTVDGQCQFAVFRQ
ncbi:hypothetical protein D3C71_1657940 [compost metagenome]